MKRLCKRGKTGITQTVPKESLPAQLCFRAHLGEETQSVNLTLAVAPMTCESIMHFYIDFCDFKHLGQKAGICIVGI